MDFIKLACARYKIQAIFVDGVYFLHKNGAGVMSFDTQRFYQLPKSYRMKMFIPLIHIGLSGNSSERNWDAIRGLYRLGKKIV